MQNYYFTGRETNGKMVSGELYAKTAEEVAELLFHRGVTPTRVIPAMGQVEENILSKVFQAKPTIDDMVLLTRQLETLTRSGVPLMRAVIGVQEGCPNAMLRNTLGQVAKALESGKDLSGAFAEHPDLFSSIYLNMIQIGEQSGQLEESFGQLYRYMEIDRETRKQIKSALRYPSFVIAAMFIAIFVVSYFVIPQFFKFYEMFNLELPWQTQALIATSKFTVEYWYIVILSALGAFFSFRYYINTETGRLWWDETKFSIPVVGSIIRRATMARFARAYAMGAKAGVPILTSLASVAEAVDNAFIGKKTRDIMNAVERGESMIQGSYSTGIFPPLVLQMMSVGEETGKMDQMMSDVAQFYEQEVAYAVKNLSALLEPIITIMMGVLVLILAVGIFLPLWDLVKIA